MRRIKRKQLKEDELVTTVTKLIRFAQKRERELIIAGVVIVVVILAFVGTKLVKSQHLKKESRFIGQVVKLYSELESNPLNLTELERLAKGEDQYARLASVILGNYWLEKGKLDKAEKFLKQVSAKKKDLFYYQSQDLLAQVYLKRKDFDRALKIYKKLEEEKPKAYTLDAILFHEAEVLEKKGDSKQALALYRRLQAEFPQTYFGYDASQKAKKLEAKK